MTKRHLIPIALLFSIPPGGCSAPSEVADNAVVATPQPTAAAARPAPAEPAPAAPANVLTLTGLGTLRIGQPVPARGSWAERGAQISDGCRTVTSPDYPGVHAIVTDGLVRRITIGKRSDVTLAGGIGIGASERAVQDQFAGFRAEPHAYEAAPAKYLTAPNAAGGDPALRFEIDRDGRVALIHVGTMPVLAYVEGCA